MKKTILSIVLLTWLCVGCGEKKSNQTDAPLVEVPEETVLDELNSIDSAAVNIENIKGEIEESSERLDDLLNDL